MNGIHKNTAQNLRRIIWTYMLCGALTMAIYVATIDAAYATTPMGSVLCTVLGWLTYGSLPRGLTTCAIIMLGIAAMNGKVSWGMAITVGVGVSIMINAVSIMTVLTGITINCGS